MKLIRNIFLAIGFIAIAFTGLLPAGSVICYSDDNIAIEVGAFGSCDCDSPANYCEVDTCCDDDHEDCKINNACEDFEFSLVINHDLQPRAYEASEYTLISITKYQTVKEILAYSTYHGDPSPELYYLGSIRLLI